MKPYKCRVCGNTEYKTFGKKERRRVCTLCHRKAGSKWARNNPEKHNAKQRRRYGTPEGKSYTRKHQLMARYGITLDQYEQMKVIQNNCCLICDLPPKGPRPLVVDHCHKTGEVRGLLCDPCNSGIGHFEDQIERLHSAIKYLTRPQGLAALRALDPGFAGPQTKQKE